MHDKIEGAVRKRNSNMHIHAGVSQRWQDHVIHVGVRIDQQQNIVFRIEVWEEMMCDQREHDCIQLRKSRRSATAQFSCISMNKQLSHLALVM